MLNEFIEPGMLVFSIGANSGDVARRCVALGAEVVAVEPDRKHIHTLTGPGITPVIAAVSDTHGTAELYLSHNDKWSSLHPEWVTGHYGKPDPDTIHVEVVTLNMLIAEFGFPGFIIIDTEGHEANVLKGLSHRVHALSFEYHGGQYPVRLDHDPIYECVTLLPGYEFRAAQHETQWVTDWIDGDALMAVMPSLTWGDVYARDTRKARR